MFKKERSIEEFVKIVDEKIILDKLPEGKKLSDFTGGYINILKNKTKVVLFFGYKEDGKNKVEISFNIDKSEEDIWLKVFQFKRDLMNKSINTVSIAETIVKSQVYEIEYTETSQSNNVLIDDEDDIFV